MRIAFYWHNGRSLGHTAETAKVAHGLADGLPDAGLAGLTGAYRGLDMLPARLDVVKLPAFVNYDRASGWALESRSALPPHALFALRAELAEVFLRHYEPDVLLVNHLPYGAERELAPALAATRSGRRILTLRGVLFDRDKTRREYFTPETTRWIAEHFDAIHVHTDPEVFRLEEHYEVPAVLQDRVRYTGYLTDESTLTRREARASLGIDDAERVVVASMGGGQGALPIWAALLDTLTALRGGLDRAVLVTGPYLEDEDLAALRARVADAEWIELRTYVPDMTTWMTASDVFVGAAGANMLGEVLATGCNAVAIPRQVREPEQRIHAGLLAARGLLRVCDLPEVLAGGLTAAVSDALGDPRTGRGGARLGGARAYPALLATAGAA